VSLEILKVTDRSILVASPEENRQYGNLFKHIRQSVNSLLEFNTRTDLNKLILKPEIFPESSRQRVHNFFKEIVFCWNLMIKYTRRRLEKDINPYDLKGWEGFPQSLQFGLLTTHRLVNDTEWIMYGDVRANMIEPHLAYVLRSLEFDLQKGLGCGQDISTVIRVKK
ncbi:MAG: class I SAM-dependent methyltransferase, partial [Bacteroidota bacterium]